MRHSRFPPFYLLSSILSIFNPSLLYFFCNAIFYLFLPFPLKSFSSNYLLTLLLHFILQKCLCHCILEAFLQQNHFFIVPGMSRAFSFSDPAEIPCPHNVHFWQSTFIILILTKLSNHHSLLQCTTHSNFCSAARQY